MLGTLGPGKPQIPVRSPITRMARNNPRPTRELYPVYGYAYVVVQKPDTVMSGFSLREVTWAGGRAKD